MERFLTLLKVLGFLAVGACGIAFVLFIFSSFIPDSTVVRYAGGEMTLDLEPNKKLVSIDWKEDDLWIVTKDMTESDIAEVYDFYSDSAFGIFEGVVHVTEHKVEENLQENAGEESNYLKEDENGNQIFTYDINDCVISE